MSINGIKAAVLIFLQKLKSLTSRRVPDDDIDVYDPDEIDELRLESALYIEAAPLRDMTFTIYPRDVYSLDTDRLLESIEQLPYEFRCYYDTRRAFSRALAECREELTGYQSYEGGRSASCSESFGFDDRRVYMDFTLSKDSDRSPYAFTVEIRSVRQQ